LAAVDLDMTRYKREEKYTQLEESISNLEHQYVRVTMVMDDKDAFHGTTHAKVFIVVLQTLQTCRNARVFLWLGFLRAIVLKIRFDGRQ
jgi:hypothetical protein